MANTLSCHPAILRNGAFVTRSPGWSLHYGPSQSPPLELHPATGVKLINTTIPILKSQNRWSTEVTVKSSC